MKDCRSWPWAARTFLACLLVAAVQDAHAYLDPGTGSLLIQVLIAGFLGASFYVAMSWKKLKKFIGSRFGKKDTE